MSRAQNTPNAGAPGIRNGTAATDPPNDENIPPNDTSRTLPAGPSAFRLPQRLPSYFPIYNPGQQPYSRALVRNLEQILDSWGWKGKHDEACNKYIRLVPKKEETQNARKKRGISPDQSSTSASGMDWEKSVPKSRILSAERLTPPPGSPANNGTGPIHDNKILQLFYRTLKPLSASTSTKPPAGGIRAARDPETKFPNNVTYLRTKDEKRAISKANRNRARPENRLSMDIPCKPNGRKSRKRKTEEEELEKIEEQIEELVNAYRTAFPTEKEIESREHAIQQCHIFMDNVELLRGLEYKEKFVAENLIVTMALRAMFVQDEGCRKLINEPDNVLKGYKKFLNYETSEEDMAILTALCLIIEYPRGINREQVTQVLIKLMDCLKYQFSLSMTKYDQAVSFAGQLMSLRCRLQIY